jgi:hypothetical protein
MADSEKLTHFPPGELASPVDFIETTPVARGVVCDVYAFRNDQSQDLAVVTVQRGCHTPLQRVMQGDETLEGLLSGHGTLMVQSEDGSVEYHRFTHAKQRQAIAVRIGQLMQWHADGEGSLVFFEQCRPPYADGRFENISE